MKNKEAYDLTKLEVHRNNIYYNKEIVGRLKSDPKHTKEALFKWLEEECEKDVYEVTWKSLSSKINRMYYDIIEGPYYDEYQNKFWQYKVTSGK